MLNAKVYTVDTRMPRAQAFAVKNSRFIAVGTNDEIKGLIGKDTRTFDAKGMTIVPLEIYFNAKGRAKLKLALAEGKKLHDKRETAAKRDWNRQKARIMRDRG